jgi:hypothetical protein
VVKIDFENNRMKYKYVLSAGEDKNDRILYSQEAHEHGSTYLENGFRFLTNLTIRQRRDESNSPVRSLLEEQNNIIMAKINEAEFMELGRNPGIRVVSYTMTIALKMIIRIPLCIPGRTSAEFQKKQTVCLTLLLPWACICVT